MPDVVFGNVNPISPSLGDEDVFKKAIQGGGRDVRVVFDPKTGEVGTDSRKGFWSSGVVRGLTMFFTSFLAGVGGAISYLILSNKADEIKAKNNTTVDRFLATMEKAYRGGDVNPEFDRLKEMVREDLKGGKSLTPEYAQKVIARYEDLSRNRMVVVEPRMEEVVVPPPGENHEPPPPPPQRIVEVRGPTVEELSLERAREQMLLDGLDITSKSWDAYSTEQIFPPEAKPTPVNMRQIYDLALAKFREANARDAKPEDLKSQAFKNAMRGAMEEFVAQQRRDIYAQPYSPNLEVGYQLERAKAMSGLDSPDKAERMLKLLRCGRTPGGEDVRPPALPTREQIQRNVMTAGLILGPMPNLSEELKDNVREQAKCKKELTDLGKALEALNKQRQDIGVLRQLVRAQHEGDVGDKQLLEALEVQLKRMTDELEVAQKSSRDKILSYLSHTKDIIPLPTEAFDAGIKPLLEGEPPEVINAFRQLLCNGYPRGDQMVMGEDPEHGRGRDEPNEEGKVPWDGQVAKQVVAWHDVINTRLRARIEETPEEGRKPLRDLQAMCMSIARPFHEGVIKMENMQEAIAAINTTRGGQPLPVVIREPFDLSRAIFDYCDSGRTTRQAFLDIQGLYKDFTDNFQSLHELLEDKSNGLSPDSLHRWREARDSLVSMERFCSGDHSRLKQMLEHPDPNIQKMARAFISLTEKSRAAFDELDREMHSRERQIIPLRRTDLSRMDGIDPLQILPSVEGRPVFGAYTSHKSDGSTAGIFEKNYIGTVPVGKPVEEFYLRIDHDSSGVEGERGKERGAKHKEDRLTVMMPFVGQSKDFFRMVNTGITRKDWDSYQAVLAKYDRGETRFTTDEVALFKRIQGQLVFGMAGKDVPPMESVLGKGSPMRRLTELVANNKIPCEMAGRIGEALSNPALRLNQEGRNMEKFYNDLITLCEIGRPGVAASLLERMEDLDLPGPKSNNGKPLRPEERQEQRHDLQFFAGDAIANPDGYALQLNTTLLTKLIIPTAPPPSRESV